ncbi:MAG: hypothetical protein HYX68_23315 [Planctomycetes bacterium]|nr:hypothetical protein [Planctomycetota bacterium]
MPVVTNKACCSRPYALCKKCSHASRLIEMRDYAENLVAVRRLNGARPLVTQAGGLTANDVDEVLDIEEARKSYDPIHNRKRHESDARIAFELAERWGHAEPSARTLVANFVQVDDVLDLESMPHRQR